MMSGSEIHHMDVSEIHQSSSSLSYYLIDKFTQCNMKMKEFTTKQGKKEREKTSCSRNHLWSNNLAHSSSQRTAGKRY